MASIKFNDGREVMLSTETTKRLRKELLNPGPPEDFESGDFSLRVSKKDSAYVEIDTDNGTTSVTRVLRRLGELKTIRNQLNIFINYLKEIENG